MKERKTYRKNRLLLGLAVLLLLAGCRRNTEDAGITEDTGKIENTGTTENAGLKEAEASVPLVSTESRKAEEYTEDGRQLLVSGEIELPVLIPEEDKDGHAELQKALESWNAKQEEDFWETVEQYKEDALGYCEMLEMSGDIEEEFYGCSINSRILYTRVDSSVLSFCQNYSDYDCGPHGNYWYEGVTFRVQDGKKLTLEDLLSEDTDFSDFCTKAGDYCIRKVKEENNEELYEDYETVIRESLLEETNWYLNAAGITVIYNPYEIGAYAMGPVFVTLPYEEFGGMLKPEYQSFRGEGTAELPLDTEVTLTLAEEKKENVRLWLEETQTDDMWDCDLWIQAGEQKEKLDDMARIGSAYILRWADGRVFLLFDADMASDDFITYLYELTDGSLRKTGETDRICSIEPGSVNPRAVKLCTRVDVMGTYSAKMDYQITEEGALYSDCSLYELENNSPWTVLTTIRELPVILDGKEASLPAGSRIRITATDLKGTAWFREEGAGTEGEIHYTQGNDDNSSWPRYIDGIEETEYFEFLPYAG